MSQILKIFLEDLATNDWQILNAYSVDDFYRGMKKCEEYATYAIEEGVANKFLLNGNLPFQGNVLDCIQINGSTTYRAYSTERGGGMLNLKIFSDFCEALSYHIYWQCNNLVVAKKVSPQ